MKKLLLIVICMILTVIWGCVDEYEQRIKNISDTVVKDCTTFEQKILALRRYVYNKAKFPDGKHVKPNGEPLRPREIWAMDVVEWIDSGYTAWCDQAAYFFMRLADKQNMTTRMVYLFAQPPRTDQHTIAEVLTLDKRWVIVDVDRDNNFEFFNEDKIATRLDIANNLDILYKNAKFKELVDQGGSWQDEKYASMFYNNLARIPLECKNHIWMEHPQYRRRLPYAILRKYSNNF